MRLQVRCSKKDRKLEVRGFEPRTSRMQSERSTTELHPHHNILWIFNII